MVDKAEVRFLVLIDLVGDERGSWMGCSGMLGEDGEEEAARSQRSPTGCLNGARSFRLAGIVFTLAQK